MKKVEKTTEKMRNEKIRNTLKKKPQTKPRRDILRAYVMR